MLGFFRRNLNFNLLAIVIFAICLHIYYMVRFTVSPVDWSWGFFSKSFGFLDSQYPRIIFSILLISIQAILLNRLVVKHKLSRALSTIPGALFVLLTCLFLESEIFHPAMLANLFFILGMGSLFGIYKKHLPIATIFNSGLFIAIATLIYPPYIIFTLVLILGLLSLRNLEIREFLQMLSGVLTPIFLIGVYFFYKGELHLVSQHFLGNMALPWKNAALDIFTWTKPLLVIITIVFLILFNSSNKKKKKFDAIKKIELCYWLLLLSLFSLFFKDGLTENHLIIVSVPIAILGGLHLETKENQILKEFFFIFLIGLFVAFQLQII